MFIKLALLYTCLLCRNNALAVDDRLFPSNFTFGVGTSAYQVEGAWNESGKGESIWDNIVHTQPDYINDGSNGDIACDSYHKIDTDVGLIKALGADYYSFSLSWSRIIPTGRLEEGISKAGVQYYNDLLDKLKENGIEAFVTLYHFDLPESLQNVSGGWLNESMITRFNDFAVIAFDRFGDRVKYWATFNEPFTICDQGYEAGGSAPDKTDNPGVDIYECSRNILRAHAVVYHYSKLLKPSLAGQVGIVLNTQWFEPGSDSENDSEAAERALQFFFGWFANPIVYGDYPQVMIDRIAERSANEGFETSRLVEFTDGEKEYLNHTFDFIGLNYYTTNTVEWMDDYEIGTPSFEKDVSVAHVGNTAVVPEGLRKILNWIKNTYNNPQIIIAENGLADSNGTVEDEHRIDYYREHLSNLLPAILDDEVNVTAFTAWSLMDSFEWTSGYSVKYGLYYVNFTDPERTRTPKASVDYYRSVIETRCLLSECTEN